MAEGFIPDLVSISEVKSSSVLGVTVDGFYGKLITLPAISLLLNTYSIKQFFYLFILGR